MITVVSPHLDDAVLSVWTVLAGAPGARVVSCFAGVPDEAPPGDWDLRAGFRSASDAVLARRREDAAALGEVGAVPVHLDLLDAQYREAGGGPSVEEVAAALRPQLAGSDVVWLPAGIGGHPDHRLAHLAALEAVGAGQPVRLYADLPYAGQPGWPAGLTGRLRDHLVDRAYARRDTRPTRVWDEALRDLVLGPVRVRVLTPAQRRAKLEALSCYRSQLAALRCGRRHPLRSRRLFAREVSWPLTGPQAVAQGLS